MNPKRRDKFNRSLENKAGSFIKFAEAPECQTDYTIIMKFLWNILIPMLLGSPVAGQKPESNLVPNPGFEDYAAPPIGWFYKGEHFTKVMKYWSAATAASPDVFGPRVRVPGHWREKGFGQQTAHGGDSMAGFTLYGCDEGKPHCREYVQVQLIEPLVVGQEYSVHFWVSSLPRALRINRIGAFFSLEEIREQTDVLLSHPPQVTTDKIVEAEDGQWVSFSGRFVADQAANYLVIGNFFPDSLTRTSTPVEDALPFAYYYLDDVLVKKEEPILPVPVPDDDLSKVEIEQGKTIPLRNIFFETDEAELLPRSYVELRKLLDLMERYPGMVIQINGHTDSRGEDDYNLDLSRRRAKAVVDFLTENGIAPERTRYRGFGSTQPVAPNDTDEGRQLNRRVEFVVLEL